MLTTAALFLCLFEHGAATPSHAGPSNVNCELCVEDIVPAPEAPQRDARYEQQDFLRRFNELAAALSAFATTYNSQGVIDVKQIKAVRKALRDLEKSDWFSQKGERR
jgi:hypothetical protein